LSDIEQIQEVHYLAGRDCLTVKLRVKDNRELETLLLTRINNIRAVSSTRTLIALSTYKESAKIAINAIS
jgi:Lrp/AsnC family leucine-responsive transcriptional regulator